MGSSNGLSGMGPMHSRSESRTRWRVPVSSMTSSVSKHGLEHADHADHWCHAHGRVGDHVGLALGNCVALPPQANWAPPSPKVRSSTPSKSYCSARSMTSSMVQSGQATVLKATLSISGRSSRGVHIGSGKPPS